MIEVRTLSEDTARLSDEEVAELQMACHGPMLSPADEDYDEARVVHNMHFDGRPGLIIQCSGFADVIDAVNLAREHELLVAVRGGGHSVAGHCSTDGGLMIDLSRMRGVWVDEDRRVVRVQGGATWGDVDRETQAVGLAVPGGIVSTTGVAGLTLGGGIGWLHRKWGLTCDSLRAVQIVTADGKLVRASAQENEDLFWGVRGGGGNFGVVVDFEFDAYPLGPIVMAAATFYPVDGAVDTFRNWRDWTSTIPDEVTSRVVFWSMPEDPNLPEPVHNQEVMIVSAVYAGGADEGEKVLQPARDLGEPLADIGDKMPFRFFQAAFDPFFPKAGLGSYWKSIYLSDVSGDALDLIADRGLNRVNDLTLVHVPTMGGAATRVDAADTAFGDRSAAYMLSVDGNWADAGESDMVIDWVRKTVSEAEGLDAASGTYLNFTGDEPTNTNVVQAAFGQNVERLTSLKTKYDPNNLFRLNNNIAPGP